MSSGFADPLDEGPPARRASRRDTKGSLKLIRAAAILGLGGIRLSW
jgi:hypothetical protein